jgi:hypothetical protein
LDRDIFLLVKVRISLPAFFSTNTGPDRADGAFSFLRVIRQKASCYDAKLKSRNSRSTSASQSSLSIVKADLGTGANLNDLFVSQWRFGETSHGPVGRCRNIAAMGTAMFRHGKSD